jgi:hypothetical protein
MVRNQSMGDEHDRHISTSDKDAAAIVCYRAEHDPSGDAADEFLSFWSSSSSPVDGPPQRHGTMSYFTNALANFKGKKSVDNWARATASTLRMEEQGFDALVSLFDESLEKNYPDGSLLCSPLSTTIDNENDCIDNSLNIADSLTPESKRVAEHIESSVRNDHEKMAAIERVCPNWLENVKFSQAQTDSIMLQRALHNVKQAAVDLDSMKDRIIRAFQDRQQTLELFEKSIQLSKDGLSDRS